MNNPPVVTSLLGRHVRLRPSTPGTRESTGQIVTVYVDSQGMHYVILVGGRLIHAEDESQFTVLDEVDW